MRWYFETSILDSSMTTTEFGLFDCRPKWLRHKQLSYRSAECTRRRWFSSWQCSKLHGEYILVTPPLVEKKAYIAGHKLGFCCKVCRGRGGGDGKYFVQKNYYLNLFLLSLGLSVEDLALVSCNTWIKKCKIYNMYSLPTNVCPTT